MKTRSTIILLALMILILLSCGRNAPQIIAIDSSKSYGNKIDSFLISKDSFDYRKITDRKIVFLETKGNNSLIGEVSRLEIFDNKIFIYDKQFGRVVCFTSTGKFLFNISTKYQIDSWSFDSLDKRIIVYNIKNRVIEFYSPTDGKFLNSIKIDFYGIEIASLGNLILFKNEYLDINGEDLKYYIFYYNLNTNKIEKVALPIKYIKEGSFQSDPFSFCNYGNSVFLLPTGSYEIYKLSKDSSMSKYISIQIPEKNKLPIDFMSPSMTGYRRKFYQFDNPQNKNIFCSIHDFTLNSRYMFCISKINGINYFSIYDIIHNKFKIYSDLYDPDKLLWGFPRIANEGTAYCSIYYQKCKEYFDYCKRHNLEIPEKLANYIKSGNPSSNPAIMFGSLNL